MFKKYQHIERYGTDEVQGIELGISYIFPKIDGTNGSVWIENGILRAGSRNRELTIENDNAGFYAFILENEKIKKFLTDYPNYRLFGEWLVPHSLKTYKENAWHKFYIFDVVIDNDTEFEYLNYDNYQEKLEAYELDYIPCIAKIKNGSYESFINWLDKNNFLITDGQGSGEGIVIKNYDYYNKFKRQTWAKIVTSEFKEKHAKVMGATEINGKKIIEEEITEKYCTKSLCEKTLEKIKLENGWSSKLIPRLLQTIYSDIVNEEIWHIIKEFKNPTINFRTLSFFITNKTKEHLKELF